VSAALASLRADAAFWLRWVGANALGELIGLGAVGAIGFAVIQAMDEPRSPLPVIAFSMFFVGLGALEGAVLGYLQARVLRERLRHLHRWIPATVFGAVAAWILGMVPSTVAGLTMVHGSVDAEPMLPEGIDLLLAPVLGLIAGMVFALPQWRVLRRHVRQARWWIAGNGIAWAFGMPVIVLVSGLPSLETPAALAVLTIGAGLALAGALVGAIHGGFLLWLLAQRRHDHH